MFAVVKSNEIDTHQLTKRAEIDSIIQWNPSMSIDETVQLLSIYERISFQSLFKVCESLYKIKEAWKKRYDFYEDKGKKRGAKPSDWSAFKAYLEENNGLSESKVDKLIKIYTSLREPSNGLHYLYKELGFLPANYTAMHEISTLEITKPNELEALQKIINELSSNKDLGVSEIRAIKNKTLNKDKNRTANEEAVNFKLPSDKESLEKLVPVWSEIEEYADKINQLMSKVGMNEIKLIMENPTTKLSIIEEKKLAKLKKNIEIICVKTDTVHSLTDLENENFIESKYAEAKKIILEMNSNKKHTKLINDEFKRLQEEREERNKKSREKKEKEITGKKGLF